MEECVPRRGGGRRKSTRVTLATSVPRSVESTVRWDQPLKKKGEGSILVFKIREVEMSRDGAKILVLSYHLALS